MLAVVGMTAFQSCEGPEGIPGPQGPEGPVSEVFEVTTSFSPSANPENSYRSFFDLNPAIFASDNVLVYELAGVVNGLDVWKLLPQVYTFPNGGILQYNFDFTTIDFSIFIDSNFDISSLNSSWTQNKTFRIVIVPGYFSKSVDTKNYEEVIKALDIDSSSVKILPQKETKK